MQDWIVILALAVALLSLLATAAVEERCRRMRREKDRRIARVLHEQDLLVRELEHVRIEKQAFERVLTTRLTAAEQSAPQEDDP